MEIRIGIRNVAREVTFESAQTPQQVRATINDALGAGGAMLELEDDKGRFILVPTEALGYVEIGTQEQGRVGFGTR